MYLKTVLRGEVSLKGGTVAINKLLYLKNAGAHIALFFTSYEKSAPMAIEKIKILGAVLELPAKQQCQSSPFT